MTVSAIFYLDGKAVQRVQMDYPPRVGEYVAFGPDPLHAYSQNVLLVTSLVWSFATYGPPECHIETRRPAMRALDVRTDARRKESS